jgi:hypothetical protein
LHDRKAFAGILPMNNQKITKMLKKKLLTAVIGTMSCTGALLPCLIQRRG